MSTPTKKRRRQRCTRCGNLTDPAELAPVGHDKLCEGCMILEAEKVPDEPEDKSQPGDPGLAEAIDSVAHRDPDLVDPQPGHEWQHLDDVWVQVPVSDEEPPPGTAEAEGDFLPAPSTQVDAPMPDLREQDEKLDAPAERWRLPSWNVPGWPLRYGRISASALGCFARCPEQFRRKYILGERDKFGAAAMIGKGIHKALERSYVYVMEQGELPPKMIAAEAFDESLARDFGKCEERWGSVDWGHDGTASKRPMDEASWRNRGERVIDVYLEEVLPTVQPLGAEVVFSTSIPNVAVPVVGFIDLITPAAMVDWKFSKNKSKAMSAEWRVQGLTYLLARDLPMTWHSANWKGEILTPLTEPGLILPPSFENYSIATDLVAGMVRAILSYAEAFGRDKPWPGNIGHTWACGTCWFRDEGDPPCVWWHRDASEPVL